MKCENCSNGMEEKDSYDRGRHTRKIFICKICGKTQIKKVGVIPNKIRSRF